MYSASSTKCRRMLHTLGLGEITLSAFPGRQRRSPDLSVNPIRPLPPSPPVDPVSSITSGKPPGCLGLGNLPRQPGRRDHNTRPPLVPSRRVPEHGIDSSGCPPSPNTVLRPLEFQPSGPPAASPLSTPGRCASAQRSRARPILPEIPTHSHPLSHNMLSHSHVTAHSCQPPQLWRRPWINLTFIS